MSVKFITNRPQKARMCRIRYPGSQRGLNGWELPPNIPGYQWIIHQRKNTRLVVLRDAATQIMFLLMAWRALQTLIATDKLCGYGLALGLLVIYAAAIQTKLFVVRAGVEDCWYYVETPIREERRRTGMNADLGTVKVPCDWQPKRQGLGGDFEP